MTYDPTNFTEFTLIDAIIEGFTNAGNPEILMDTGRHISEEDINFDRSLPGSHAVNIFYLN